MNNNNDKTLGDVNNVRCSDHKDDNYNVDDVGIYNAINNKDDDGF